MGVFKQFFGRKRNSLDDLVDYLEKVSEDLPPKAVDGFDKSEPELIKKFVTDTREFVEVNESELGAECLLENLYEIDFQLDDQAYNLVWKVVDDWGFSRDQFGYLKELKK